MPSFTVRLPDLDKDGPLVEARLHLPSALEQIFKKAGKSPPPPKIVTAMIDTGATSSVVRSGIPKALGLQPVGVGFVSTATATGVPCDKFLLRYTLPSNVSGETPMIAAAMPRLPVDFLIGRDILSESVLIYIGYAGTFTLSR